jgi:hypothetical protein
MLIEVHDTTDGCKRNQNNIQGRVDRMPNTVVQKYDTAFMGSCAKSLARGRISRSGIYARNPPLSVECGPYAAAEQIS